MSIRVTVVVQKEENWYVAKCIENSVASQGKTIEESLINLREALELYYEDTPFDADNFPTFITTMEVAIASRNHQHSRGLWFPENITKGQSC